MTWKQCVLPFEFDYAPIQMAVADHAFIIGYSPDYAIFVHTPPDYESNILLLSPGAAFMADRLPGTWTEIPKPNEPAQGWTLLYGPADASAAMGLPLPGGFGS